MNRQVAKKIFLYVSMLSLILFAIGLSVSLSKIYNEVKSICREAKKEFNSDSVSALIAYSKSGNHSEKEKIKAIWALGQLADDTALPYLENLCSLYNCPEKNNYESYLCYEVKKAIKWCKKGNLTHYMYKKREEW